MKYSAKLSLLFCLIIFQTNVLSATPSISETINYIEAKSEFQATFGGGTGPVMVSARLEAIDYGRFERHLIENGEEKTDGVNCQNISYLEVVATKDRIESMILIHKKSTNEPLVIHLTPGNEVGVANAMAHLCELVDLPISVGDPFA